MERLRLPFTNAMFHAKRGANINIHNGTFIQHNQPQPSEEAVHICYKAKDGFKHLQAHVTTTAFDSAQKVDAPKCHPNTRHAVQEEIMRWILLTVTRVHWMLWLNGAAGAGKSAIARSIVALCLAGNIPIARFFFFRTDPTRNTIQPVVATLVHQLIQQIPNLLAIVVRKMNSDPLIFTKSLETQLQYLIFEPLRQLHRKSPLRVIVLLFDGVDECGGYDNQTDLVSLIANFLSSRDLPIIAFFGSRAENQLQQVFQSNEVSTSLHQLALDDHYLPDADIRLFLNDKFKQIRKTHPFNRHLPKTWPNPAHVQEIIQKSSGQFIFASVVINFVSSPHRHPARQLDITRGLRPPGNLTPFAQLDSLYRHIFSQIEDIDRTLLILAWHIFGTSNYYPQLEGFFGMSSDSICVLMADLASIIVYEDDNIRFLHASLPDFLLDQSRSQEYYLEKRFWCTRLSIHCFRRISTGNMAVFYYLKDNFLPYAEITSELEWEVLALDLSKLNDLYILLIEYLTVIRRLDFGDDGELYLGQLKRIIRYILEHPHDSDTDTMSELYQLHNISGFSVVLGQIETEKADGVNRIAVRNGKIKATFRSILKVRRKKRIAVPANKAAAEVVASAQKRAQRKSSHGSGGRQYFGD